MNNESPSTCLVLDETADFGDLYDAMQERLVNCQAIMSAIMNDDHWRTMLETEQSNALWAISSLVNEAMAMSQMAHIRQKKKASHEWPKGEARHAAITSQGTLST